MAKATKGRTVVEATRSLTKGDDNCRAPQMAQQGLTWREALARWDGSKEGRFKYDVSTLCALFLSLSNSDILEAHTTTASPARAPPPRKDGSCSKVYCVTKNGECMTGADGATCSNDGGVAKDGACMTEADGAVCSNDGACTTKADSATCSKDGGAAKHGVCKIYIYIPAWGHLAVRRSLLWWLSPPASA